MAMENLEAKSQELKTTKLLLISQICLRIVASITSLAASWKMFLSKQTVILFGMSFQARYSYTPAFKYFAFINAFACGFILLSLVCMFFFNRRGFTPNNFFSLFLHDLLMMSLLLSSVSAGTAIGYLGRYGNSHTGWLQICDNLPDFCNKEGFNEQVPPFLSNNVQVNFSNRSRNIAWFRRAGKRMSLPGRLQSGWRTWAERD